MQEQAEAKLGGALKVTGYAAGFTQKQLEDYASELQNMTTFGDKQAEQVMNAVCDIKMGLGGILILFGAAGSI